MIVVSSDSEEDDSEECMEEGTEMSEEEDLEECSEDKIRPYFVELMKCLNLPRFGGAKGITEAWKFLTQLEAKYMEYKCSPSEGLMMAECHLVDEVEIWWKVTREIVDDYYGGSVWGQFRRTFTKEYLSRKQESDLVETEPLKKESRVLEEIAGRIKVEGKPAYALFDTGAACPMWMKNMRRRKD